MLNLGNMTTKAKLYFVTGSLLVGLGVVGTISYNAAQSLAAESIKMYEDPVLGLQNSANAGMQVQRTRFLSKIITDESLKGYLNDSIKDLEDAIAKEKKTFDDFEKTMRVSNANVSRFEITVSGHAACSFVGTLPITRHHLGAFNGYFSSLP